MLHTRLAAVGAESGCCDCLPQQPSSPLTSLVRGMRMQVQVHIQTQMQLRLLHLPRPNRGVRLQEGPHLPWSHSSTPHHRRMKQVSRLPPLGLMRM
mgnify:CR=1 FL=1